MLVRPSGSHHGARRTSAVYSTAACLDHHRCKLQSIATTHILGWTSPPPNMASTVPSSHRFMGQRCQDAPLQIWNLFVRREKNSRKSQAPKWMQTAKRLKTLEKVEKLKGVKAVGELFFLDYIKSLKSMVLPGCQERMCHCSRNSWYRLPGLFFLAAPVAKI